jgi:uncharacterized protein
MSDSQLLYRLQTIDLALNTKRVRLKAIQTALGDDQQVQAAQAQVEVAAKRVRTWQSRSRTLENEITDLTEKITATDASLYSGKVSNPKVLQEMQEEIDALKRRRSQLEDELLSAMEQLEAETVSQSATQSELAAVQGERSDAHKELLAEKQRLEGEVQALSGQRKTSAAGIPPEALSAYEALRPKKNGHAVSQLRGESCSICNVEQTSNVVQQVRRGVGIVYCTSCGRILSMP